VVTLPGTHKLKTLCNLVVGDHALRVEAFVMRQPDENRRSCGPGCCSATPACTGWRSRIDTVGDVYLVGRCRCTP
jgi:hypothetical protein